MQNGSSLILIVAPNALNLKPYRGEQAQKRIQFFNRKIQMTSGKYMLSTSCCRI
jgi:hypothetical protein